MAKRLTRDVRNKKIAGVCAGIANYFDIDPTIVRLIWGVAFFVYGIGLIPYLILWFVLPEDDGNDDVIWKSAMLFQKWKHGASAFFLHWISVQFVV